VSYHRYITDDDRGASVPIKLLHSSQSTLSSFAPLHVISWPYLDIVSALKVGEHLLSLVRRCLTLCLMIYKILQSAHRPSDSRWRLIFSLPISTFSALGVSHVMRSINVRYLLTYLLDPPTQWIANRQQQEQEAQLLLKLRLLALHVIGNSCIQRMFFCEHGIYSSWRCSSSYGQLLAYSRWYC